MVALDGVAVGTTEVQGMKADGAIMDTGTSLITTSSGDAAAINSVRTTPSKKGISRHGKGAPDQLV